MRLPSLVGLLSFMVVAAPAFHASAQSANIAVVNVQDIMRDSTAAKSVREQLESKQKAYQSELSKKEEALQKEDQELAKQKSVLAKEAFDEKVKAFRAKATEMQKDVQAKKASFENAFQNAGGQIQKTVMEIISDMAKEKGFIVAIPTSQVLYADSSLDISQEVLKRLNERLPRVEVKFSAPAETKKK